MPLPYQSPVNGKQNIGHSKTVSVQIRQTTVGKTNILPGSSSIPTISPTAEKANRILERAKKQYKSGDFVGAIALLKSISNNSSDFQEAAAIIFEWQQNWQKAESLFNDINQALDNGQWEMLGDYQRNLEKLPDIKYWRNKI